MSHKRDTPSSDGKFLTLSDTSPSTSEPRNPQDGKKVDAIEDLAPQEHDSTVENMRQHPEDIGLGMTSADLQSSDLEVLIWTLGRIDQILAPYEKPDPARNFPLNVPAWVLDLREVRDAIRRHTKQ